MKRRTRRTRRNATTKTKMMMGTRAIRSERALGVAKSRLISPVELPSCPSFFEFATNRDFVTYLERKTGPQLCLYKPMMATRPSEGAR